MHDEGGRIDLLKLRMHAVIIGLGIKVSISTSVGMSMSVGMSISVACEAPPPNGWDCRVRLYDLASGQGQGRVWEVGESEWVMVVTTRAAHGRVTHARTLTMHSAQLHKRRRIVIYHSEV